MSARSGGRILVDQLVRQGVTTVFGVPGESYLAVLDALFDVQDKIRFIVGRQEGGSAYSAEAYGKLTGRPGICLVTRGPGATNASIGVHAASQNSSPMILFAGQVPRGDRGRDSFQEIDYRSMFGHLAKWVDEIDDPGRIPELVARAFQVAISGRPGPVVLALPEDMLTQAVDVADAERVRAPLLQPAEADMERLRNLVAAAERPLVIAGGSTWTAEASERFRVFAEAGGLPVATGFRRQDLFDNSSPSYAGALGLSTNPYLQDALREADLVIVAGGRPDAITTGEFSLLQAPRPTQGLVHVSPGIEDLGRVYRADLLINATAAEFAAAWIRTPGAHRESWRARTASLHAEYERCLVPNPSRAGLDYPSIVAHLSRTMPPDTVVTLGAGRYTGACQRHYRFTRLGTQLAGQVGAMGYGLPAAIAAKTVHPDREVVAFAGDGCFLMTGQELATAMQFDLPLIVIVVNDASYGAIRAHQDREYPGRTLGTDLVNPDFAAFARAFGAHGEVVERTDQFPGALERSRAAGRPAIIELRLATE